MTVYEYDSAQLTIGGKIVPIGPVVLRGSPREPLPPIDASFTCEGPFPCDEVARLVPARPTGQAVASMPWGILGTLSVPFVVVGADPMRETADGVTLTMHGEMTPHAWRRALSMAVQQAIMSRPRRVAVASRAILGDSANLHALGDAVLRKRGERKKRRAMRRLLRAAGITKEMGR